VNIIVWWLVEQLDGGRMTRGHCRMEIHVRGTVLTSSAWCNSDYLLVIPGTFYAHTYQIQPHL
jgi:hypothetical protein